MSVRWRLGMLALQLAILLAATAYVTGHIVAGETWFLAGLLAVVINPQLLEPWYPKPQDVIANALIAAFLIWTAPAGPAKPGWMVLGGFIGLGGIAALLALALGAGKREGRAAVLARTSAGISRVASAGVIYSAVFWLAAIDYRSQLDSKFWTLGLAWALLMFLGHVNWQGAWSTITGAPSPCCAEGMIGPTTLLVTSASLPPPGSQVQLIGHRCPATIGTMLARIRRANDMWGQVHLEDATQCETLVGRSAFRIEMLSTDTMSRFVGAVEAGSTDRSLRFAPTRPLEIGNVLCVNSATSQILYQLSFAEIQELSIRGGSHLSVRARATQLGSYSPETRRILRHPWVPPPGAAVRLVDDRVVDLGAMPPDGSFMVGNAIGTPIPVYLDLQAICQGHLAILGMTRMGKTTLALRLAHALASGRRVTILDQTGEYVGRRRLEPYCEAHDALDEGLSVFEPPPGRVAADEAYQFLDRIVRRASEEYRDGHLRSRVLIIDEAHQFIPEPAGLGFNAPGRDSAYKFGVLMMQVRKFGITIVLISQRTAVVGKSALSQCENLIAFRSVDQTGLDYLEAVVGEDARLFLPALRHAQALVSGPAASTDAPIAVQVSAP